MTALTTAALPTPPSIANAEPRWADPRARPRRRVHGPARRHDRQRRGARRSAPTSAAASSALQWIAGGYALTFAVGLVTGGRLGDIFGRRRMFLLGVAGFAAASLLCGARARPETLIAARLAAGRCRGDHDPAGLRDHPLRSFPPDEIGKAFAPVRPRDRRSAPCSGRCSAACSSSRPARRGLADDLPRQPPARRRRARRAPGCCRSRARSNRRRSTSPARCSSPSPPACSSSR